ncbi:DUF3488 and transglutaminase-like domain-containing protein [Yonghaparkia sp. Soil809]|uniref:DUF3488 and transglutaminase-like domain-containing protein n=1 Tax=Yonghaparkia sp. Soil809 TaxID=1736417 RepID=UPI0006F88880|nr:DUF3488 and transglutaminase-like domain-containing protein [Yonghaparkia sp. Soil809]KRF30866.1 hypothetical protein ASG83_08375 [Yonghaparkia sp. Soil809]
MAEAESQGTRRVAGRGARAGRGTVLVPLAALLMLAAALSAFTVLLDEGPWFASTMVVVAVVVGAGALARLRARRWRPAWSVLASSAALVVILTAVFAAEVSFAVVVPTADTLERFSELVAAGEQSIAEQSLPAEADPGIRFLLALGVGGIAIVTDALASLSRRPALAVVPALGILAVPVVLAPGALPLPTVVATAAAYLLMLALHRPAAIGGGAGVARAVTAAAVVLVAAVVVPPALPSVLAGDRLPGSGPAGLVTGINPVVELGDDLRRQNPVTVLTYSTGLEGGQYLTLSHLAEFAGQEVLPVPFEAETREAGEIGPPAWFADDVAFTSVETTITLRSVRSRWVPLPSAPVRADGLTGGWVIDPDGVTMRTAEGSIRNGTYTVENRLARPTPEQLRATTVDAPGLDQYRALPEDIDPIIEATAREVVAGIDNPYEQAVALQRFFTDGGFTYSEDAPVEGGFDGSGAEIVAAFLEARSGYCVHFGSAMTLMARTLGIPTRMAVGFLPGSRNPVIPSEYTVSSDDLHTWPELHFDGIGWVRFEPTPSRGVTPDYATEEALTPSGSPSPDPLTPEPIEPTATATPGAPSPGASGGPDLPDEQIDAGGTASGGLLGGRSTIGGVDARLVLALALMLVLALLAAPGVWRAVLRARRLRSPDPLDAWRELRDTARDLGLPAESTRTPRELARAWAGVGAGGGARAGAGAAGGVAEPSAGELEVFEAVRRALEARAYGAPAAVSGAPDIRPALRALRARTPWWRQLLAAVGPRSLASREPRDPALELPAAPA